MDNGNNLSDRYSKGLIKGKVTATAGIRNPNGVLLAYGVGANSYDILRILQRENLFKIIWYISFFILGTACLVIEPRSYLQVIDLFIVMVNVDLIGRGKLAGIYVGIFECLLYSFISFRSGLYGEIIKIMCISVPLNIYAIINWSKNLKKEKSSSNEIVIKKLKGKDYLWCAGLFIVILVPSYFLLQVLGTNVLIFSTLAFTATILLKILSAMRYMENWIFSIVADGIGFVMWLFVIIETYTATGTFSMIEFPMLLWYLATISNAINAYGIWKTMYRRVAINGRVYLAKRKVKISKVARLRRRYRKLVWNKEIDMAKNT